MLLTLVAGLGAAAALWFSCGRLEAASHRLGTYYRLPDVVKGSVITAVASSFPELATAVLAIPVHADFELGLAAIIGSAIFNILIIPACSVFAIGRGLSANRAVVYREAQFYLVSVVALLLVICLAVIYGGSGPLAEPTSTVISGTFTWQLALIPIALYGVYLYIQFEEVKEHRANGEADATPRPEGSPWRDWATLILMMGVIFLGVEVLIRVATNLGQLLGTPTFLWGLTVVAAATSIPDTFISVKAARLGRSESSISNALGSNVFDLLIAVPAGVLIAGSITVNFTQTVPLMGFLMIATVVVLAFMLRDMKISIREAWTMTLMYIGFGTWMALEAFGVTSILGLSVVG